MDAAGTLDHPCSLEHQSRLSGGQTGVIKADLGHKVVVDTLKVALFAIDKTTIALQQEDVSTQIDGLGVGTSNLN